MSQNNTSKPRATTEQVSGENEEQIDRIKKVSQFAEELNIGF